MWIVLFPFPWKLLVTGHECFLQFLAIYMHSFLINVCALRRDRPVVYSGRMWKTNFGHCRIYSYNQCTLYSMCSRMLIKYRLPNSHKSGYARRERLRLKILVLCLLCVRQVLHSRTWHQLIVHFQTLYLVHSVTLD